MLLGPLLGSAIYSIGGYQWVFFSTGILGASILIISVILIPNSANCNLSKTKVDPKKIFKFIFEPRVFLFLIPTTIMVSTSGFKSSSFSLYCKDYLGISNESSGYMFLPFSIGFFVAAPIYGVLVKLGYGCIVEILAQFFNCFILFCLFIPQILHVFENIYYILSILFIYGVAQSSVFNPHFLIMEKIALSMGYKNIPEIRTLSASCYGLLIASSKAVGASLFGGYINEWIGYYNTCLCYACLLLLTSIWMTLFLFYQGLAKKDVFYKSNDDWRLSTNLDKDYDEKSLNDDAFI